MKTYILLGLMQIALIPAFAQRGGHGSDHNYNGSRSGGGHSYSGSHNGGGRNNNGNPASSHSFRPSPGREMGHYSAAPAIRGGKSEYAARPGRYYASVERPYYRGYERYRGYEPIVSRPELYRNRVFGWGLGYWNAGLVWQQRFYLDLFNCYDAGGYYSPEYYNGSVSDFDQVLQSINNQQYDENKMAVAKEAIAYRNLSASQTAEIMNSFASDQAKIDFAEFAYTHVSDKQNFYTVNNTFKNADSAQQLGSYLDAQYGNQSSPAR